MSESLIRTELLLGSEAMQKLKHSRVAVFGIGGVGSFAAEALARSGVGTLALFDHDKVCESNINRQLIALRSTIGRNKVDVMRERIADINPDVKVEAFCCYYTPANADDIDLSGYDYIIDAIDTVTSKLELVARAKAAGVPIISAMGAGSKLDPTRFEVTDIKKTTMCPLARIMRKELKKRGITSLKVVYSKEEPIIPDEIEPPTDGQRRLIPSIAFVPSVAGLIITGEVIKDLAGIPRQT